MKNVKSLPLLSSVTFNNVEDNICFIRFDRTNCAQSVLQFEQNFRSVYLFSFVSSLVLDDHSMLSSCQTWHSVSINIARCCIVSFFIINFFFFVVEQKSLSQAEFRCFYIAFLSDSWQWFTRADLIDSHGITFSNLYTNFFYSSTCYSQIIKHLSRVIRLFKIWLRIFIRTYFFFCSCSVIFEYY